MSLLNVNAYQDTLGRGTLVELYGIQPFINNTAFSDTVNLLTLIGYP